MLELHVFDGGVKRDRIERFVIPYAGRFEFELIEKIEFGS